MIIVRLTGGLGNQMFQYAAARRLAYVNNTQLFLDIQSYHRNSERSYALPPFNVMGAIAKHADVKGFQGRNRIQALRYWLHTRLPNQNYKWIKQQTIEFDSNILDLCGSIYLDGTWQSEKYFHDIQLLIAEEFTLRDAPSGQNAELCEHIVDSASVSIHIRRGDYINNPRTQKLHGNLTADYYHRSLAILTKKISSPKLFIFSDEPEWARQNLRLPFPTTVINHNSPDQAHEDLRLMSLCKHHIIANSSFSWWGAWLSKHPEKQVFAPCRWFNSINNDIRDLIPNDWHLVEV